MDFNFKITFWIITFSILFALSATAQVNTEKFRQHTKDEGFVFTSKVRFGYSEGNTNYTSMDGTARLDFNSHDIDAFIVTNYNYKETNKGKVENKGFVHLRTIKPISKKISWESFIQQEFNEFVALADRKLLGGSFRLLLPELRSEDDSLTGLKSKMGLGLMYEREVYNVPDELNDQTKLITLRATSYLTLDWAISNRVNSWAVLYYQPKLNRLANYRLVFESGLEVKIIEKLYLTLDISYRFNSHPVGDYKKYDFIFKNGFRLTIP